MDEAAGVLLDVDAGDPGSPRLAADELEVSVDRQREIVLRNLVALGQVGVEVVLAVELAEGRNLAVERDAGQDAASMAAWFSTGSAPGSRRRRGRRGCSAARRRTRPSSRSTSWIREQLGVDFESDDRLVAVAGRASSRPDQELTKSDPARRS